MLPALMALLGSGGGAAAAGGAGAAGAGAGAGGMAGMAPMAGMMGGGGMMKNPMEAAQSGGMLGSILSGAQKLPRPNRAPLPGQAQAPVMQTAGGQAPAAPAINPQETAGTGLGLLAKKLLGERKQAEPDEGAESY